MKPANVTYFCQSDLKYAKNDLKLDKNIYGIKWDFPRGDLLLILSMFNSLYYSVIDFGFRFLLDCSFQVWLLELSVVALLASAWNNLPCKLIIVSKI